MFDNVREVRKEDVVNKMIDLGLDHKNDDVFINFLAEHNIPVSLKMMNVHDHCEWHLIMTYDRQFLIKVFSKRSEADNFCYNNDLQLTNPSFNNREDDW